MPQMKTRLTWALALGIAAVSQAATIDVDRAGIDTILGRGQSGVTEGYNTNSNTTRVGVAGSSGNNTRRDMDLIYRYTLPTLSAGEAIESFTFRFQVIGARDGASQDFRLDVYLLDVVDPSSTGTGLFLRGNSDPDHAYLGDYYFDVGTSQTAIDPPADASFTIDSTTNASALALLQSFYGGDETPDQTEVSFRFNLDESLPALSASSAYNRYDINDDVSASGLQIVTVPEPGSLALLTAGSLYMLHRRRY